MFDIYSLAKPRVFMMADVGGSNESQDTDDTQEEKYTPETTEHDYIDARIAVLPFDTAEEYGFPEAAGRILIDNEAPTVGGYTLNMKTAFEDLGATANEYRNRPASFDGAFRAEFRPKQGLHNLDFTTPATPSDDQGGTDQAQ